VNLVGRGRAQGGVKGQVAGVSVGRFRPDIPAPFALGAGLAAAAGAAPCEPVERGVQAPRVEFLAGRDLLAAFPPTIVLRRARDNLAGGVDGPLVLRLSGFTLYGRFFFTGDCSTISSSEKSSSGPYSARAASS
jgi:hypothetical protein